MQLCTVQSPHELLDGWSILTLVYHVETGGDTCEEHGLWIGARTQHSMLRMFPHKKKIHSSSLPSLSQFQQNGACWGPVGPGLTAEHEKFRGMPSGHRSLSEEKRKSNLLPQSWNAISDCTAAGGKFNSAAAPQPLSQPRKPGSHDTPQLPLLCRGYWVRKFHPTSCTL